MKDFNQIYEGQLKSGFYQLESMRKRAALFYIIGFMFFLVAAGSFVSIIVVNVFSPIIALFIFGGIIVGIGFRIIGSKMKKPYYNEFKKTVVPQMVKAFNPEWKYTSDGHIGSLEYNSSKMFNHSYEVYTGDDLIQGQMEGIQFKCSDLKVGYYTEETDSDGDRKSVYNSVFGGKFFVADLHQSIPGETHIIYDDLKTQFEALRNTSNSASRKGGLTPISDKEFSKIFKVYSTDFKQTQLLLNTEVRKALLRYYEKQKYPINISIIGKRINIAITISNLFEPRIFKPGISYKDIERQYQMFELYEILIHNWKRLNEE